MGTFLHRGPVKNHGGVRSPETLIAEGGPKDLSLWALCEGNREGYPLLGTLKVN